MEKFNEEEYFRKKRNLEEEENELMLDIKRLRQNIDLQKEISSQNSLLQKELYESSVGSQIQSEIYEIGNVIEQNDYNTLVKLEQQLNNELKDLRRNNDLKEENYKKYLKIKKEGNE